MILSSFRPDAITASGLFYGRRNVKDAKKLVVHAT